MRAQKISATIAGLGLAGLLAAPLMPTANAIPIIPGGGSGSGNAAATDENADGGDKAADTNKDGAGNENNGTISGLDDEADDAAAAAGGNGKSITSTVTTTTTPAPAGNGAGAGAGATATEPAPAGATDVTGAGTGGADQAADPAAQPAQEELALTGNSTQVFAATLAVLALLAAGGYVVAMRRTTA